MVEFSQYKALFIQTTQEYLQIFLAQLEILKVSPTDQSALTEARRMVHTIKSRSLLMGYAQLGALCKDLEELFYQAMNNTRTLDMQIINELAQINQQMIDFVGAVEQNVQVPDLKSNINTVQTIIGKR